MHGGIYFSLSLSPTDIMEELYRDLPPLEKGIYADIMKIFQADRAVTVQPTAHYFEGGVRIDERCAAGLAGLYAAGECTGGMFGANRVSAATTEMLVEGARAGESAGLFAKEAGTAMASSGKLEELEHALCAGFGRKGRTTTTQMLRRLRACVGESLTVVRTEQRWQKHCKQCGKWAGRWTPLGLPTIPAYITVNGWNLSACAICSSPPRRFCSPPWRAKRAAAYMCAQIISSRTTCIF